MLGGDRKKQGETPCGRLGVGRAVRLDSRDRVPDHTGSAHQPSRDRGREKVVGVLDRLDLDCAKFQGNGT